MFTIKRRCVKVATFLVGLSVTTAFSADLPDFTSLIKQNAPTVVQIDTKMRPVRGPRETIAPEELLRYFFEGIPPQSQIPQEAAPSAAHGSGFIIDSEGYILTNAHVVKGGDEIVVSTTDQTEYDAKLIGIDERSDVALLKIAKKGLPAAQIGDSDNVEVGNWVLAIGSPFGFDYTATKGIISAVSRSLPDGTYVPFIQTDAAVNPGNSGGPLFNLKGEVIAINSQIYSKTGSFNGLAFAIPINTAMNVAEQLKKQGFVSRGWLGVAIQGVDQELATSFKLDKPQGALVSALVDDSPAELAGIEPGDIILSIDGKTINKSNELPPIVGTIAIGATVNVELLREGLRKKLPVTIGELDEENRPRAIASPHITKQIPDGANAKGMHVRELSAKQKSLLSTNGVIIDVIKSGSRADNAGLLVGDVIINIDKQIVTNTADFKRIMSNIDPNSPVAILILRQGRSFFVPI